MEGKSDVFQVLRPTCVALLQAAKLLAEWQGSVQIIEKHLERLEHQLTLSIRPSNSLYPRLAEYVFFPISQVLQVSRQVSIRCLELSLQCVAILIEYGWKQELPSTMAGQLVILCTLLAEKNPKGLGFTESTEELQRSAFSCLQHLFSVLEPDSEFSTFLSSEGNIPQLGNTIVTLLDGVEQGSSSNSQIAATRALEALLIHLTDREVHANFLPGIASGLGKVLAPQTRQRRHAQVLIGSLRILQHLIVSTLGEQREQRVLSDTNDATIQSSAVSIIDTSWQETAATRLGPVLSSVMRLTTHARDDVQTALAELCLSMIRECKNTLPNITQPALDTIVSIAATQDSSTLLFEMEMIAHREELVITALQRMLFDRVQALPIATQASDERNRVMKLREITTLYRFLDQVGTLSTTTIRSLAPALRDSVIMIMDTPGSKEEPRASALAVQSFQDDVFSTTTGSMTFISPLIRYRGQEEILEHVARFAKTVSSSSAFPEIAANLVREIRQSQGNAQIAGFWLLLTTMNDHVRYREETESYLLDSAQSSSVFDQVLQELYALSMSLLTESSDQLVDWRLQSLAIQCLALQAQQLGAGFRVELVDALYPILHTLATPELQLQRDSMTALNIFQSACGYASVKDLIVDNVDYLTNAVALKLNAFDITPQAPQVLLMMVRLAGPSLLSYLEDIVESIFAALEDYHGYPLLVELLFNVLSVMTEEGVKAPQLAILDLASSATSGLTVEQWKPATVADLAAQLQRRADEDTHSVETEGPTSVPQRPWKADADRGSDTAEGEEDQPMDDVAEIEEPPPATKTYNLLFRITELTQHFLPSSSPSLRQSLLGLIRTTVPAISKHETSFLPLINTLWPEITSRIDDEEPYVVVAALDAVRVLCEYAGDFMRTRITQLWPQLTELYEQNMSGGAPLTTLSVDLRLVPQEHHRMLTTHSTTSKQSLKREPIVHTIPTDTSKRLLRNAIIVAVASIVRHVQISPDHFDEALLMLAPSLKQDDVRQTLEEVNADAVWLAKREDLTKVPEMPEVPVGYSWKFAEVLT